MISLLPEAAPLGLGFFLGCNRLLDAELGNHGLALVGAFDIHTGVFKVALRDAYLIGLNSAGAPNSMSCPFDFSK